MIVAKKINTWLLHFFLMNLLIIYVIAYQYFNEIIFVKFYYVENENFNQIGSFTQLKANLYIIITYLAYFSLLTLAAILPAELLSRITKKTLPVMITAVVSVSCFILFIIGDLFVFNLYRFHLNNTVFQMLFSVHRSAIFQLSVNEWMLVYGGCSLVVITETVLAFFLWKNQRIDLSKGIKRFIIGSFLLMGISVTAALSAHSRYYIHQTNIFPYYSEVIRQLYKISKEEINTFINSRYITESNFPSRPLRYPRSPLDCPVGETKPLNIFIILIDTWRFDALSPKITPNMDKFAANNLRFEKHFSAGDATQPGVFSFFYGMPATYWTACYKQKKGPVFISELLKKHYQFGLFPSASLAVPDFTATVFRELPAFTKNTLVGTPLERDEQVTKNFLQFLKNRNKDKPIFSFLFYDGVHGYCADRKKVGPFQPELTACNRFRLDNSYDKKLFYNRYLNSVYFVDQEVGAVLEGIKKANLLDNSLIIISADHGEEFNDNHENYWGHTSNFTKYQLQVPLIVHWPGKSKAVYSHITTHYDIVPTVLREALHCKTAANDFAYGRSLLDDKARFPLIVSNNYCVGYITKNTITTLFPSGDFIVQDLQAKFIENKPQQSQELSSLFENLNKFYAGIGDN